MTLADDFVKHLEEKGWTKHKTTQQYELTLQ